MIGHQTEGVAAPGIALHDLGQELAELLPICVLEIDGLSGIAATGEVIDRPWKLNP